MTAASSPEDNGTVVWVDLTAPETVAAVHDAICDRACTVEHCLTFPASAKCVKALFAILEHA